MRTILGNPHNRDSGYSQPQNNVLQVRTYRILRDVFFGTVDSRTRGDYDDHNTIIALAPNSRRLLRAARYGLIKLPQRVDM